MGLDLGFTQGTQGTASLARLARAGLAELGQSALEAPGRRRGAELRPERVEAGEEPARSTATRETGAGTPALDSLRGDEERASRERTRLHESLAESRERLANNPALALAPKNHAVTYRLFPELPYPYQGQVVDRTTLDVVRSVPSQPRIELARRYQEHLGQLIDTAA